MIMRVKVCHFGDMIRPPTSLMVTSVPPLDHPRANYRIISGLIERELAQRYPSTARDGR